MNILYSTNCPKCKVLKQKLDAAKIDYEEYNDVDSMIKMGIKSAPVLEVDGTKMDFATAVKWVKESAV